MRARTIFFLIMMSISNKLCGQEVTKITQPVILISSYGGNILQRQITNTQKSKHLSIYSDNTDKEKNKYEYYTQCAVLIEIEHRNIFGAKFIVCKKQGFFLGGKSTFHAPDGKKYDWAQNKAETFYKSDFLGYSKTQYYGFNIGYVYMILNKRSFLYSGIGFIHSSEYRQYYDNTFTKWSKNYYIEDGSISKTDYDFLLGTYLEFQSCMISLGYSSGSAGIVLGLGYSFY
jgi:hypothetical protein